MSCPTLSRKYATARAVRSSALTWKPKGVSSRTEGTGGGPRRPNSSRCVLTMVGLVSPDPMITRSRGRLMRTARAEDPLPSPAHEREEATGSCEEAVERAAVEQIGQLDRMLGV